jgi:hypothetical protein
VNSHSFNFLKACWILAPAGLRLNNSTLCPHCIYVLCIYLRTNSDLCHLQHKLIGFYNRDEKCLQRGTDWGFKQSSLSFVSKWLILQVIITDDNERTKGLHGGGIFAAKLCICLVTFWNCSFLSFEAHKLRTTELDDFRIYWGEHHIVRFWFRTPYKLVGTRQSFEGDSTSFCRISVSLNSGTHQLFQPIHFVSVTRTFWVTEQVFFSSVHRRNCETRSITTLIKSVCWWTATHSKVLYHLVGQWIVRCYIFPVCWVHWILGGLRPFSYEKSRD